MVSFIVDKYKFRNYHFEIIFDSGMGVGCDYFIIITRIWKNKKGRNRKKHILTREFYFEDNEHHFKNFAKKFVFDEQYRKSCMNGTIRWSRLSEWYTENSFYYYNIFQIRKHALASDKEARRDLNEQTKITYERCYQLYKILNKNLEWLESTPEYQEHSKIETSDPNCNGRMEAHMKHIVSTFNNIPGVKTKFSCQGKIRGIEIDEWKYGKIWFPSIHELYAHVSFSKIPEQLKHDLDEFMGRKGIARYNFGYNKIESYGPSFNEDFVLLLEQFIKRI